MVTITWVVIIMAMTMDMALAQVMEVLISMSILMTISIKIIIHLLSTNMMLKTQRITTQANPTFATITIPPKALSNTMIQHAVPTRRPHLLQMLKLRTIVEKSQIQSSPLMRPKPQK